MTSGRSPLKYTFARLGRRANLCTVRTRVTVAAGLALTVAVLLGLVVMYLFQAGSTSTTTSLRSQVNETFSHLLAIGLPGLLVLACGTIWLVVGRALGPVERIRRAADAITAADLSQRVPEPGTDDEIGHLARTMNDMLTRLEDSAARQRRFVADASHELRTPLTAIRTSLEVGLSHPATASWPDIARRAARQSQRMEKLTAQLLLLAKSDAGQLARRGRRTDLHALLTEVSTTIPAPGISIDTDLQRGTATTGNPDELSRLFRNLIENAVRYARRQVLITAVPATCSIVVEVIDDGPGIPASERERVFGRFVRLDPSRGAASGSAGLGLAIARDIATAHGATIEFANAEGGGARAIVTLPGTADGTWEVQPVTGPGPAVRLAWRSRRRGCAGRRERECRARRSGP